MKKMTVAYISINRGFWALIDDEGNKYEPINMPEQLKKDGAESTIWFSKVPDASSINMYGDIIKITGFSVE